jgi:predicted transcriptional regulator
LDDTLKDKLDREVRLRRTTQSQLIRDAIVKYLGILDENNSD